ncbi:MAG TPA: radical SAM protein [Clostridia bacterium]|nr:radical SAM protein [Clostridia bacterium]
MCDGDELFIKTQAREAITDLNTLPFTDRSLIDNDIYCRYRNHTLFYHTLPLFTTRGCPYHCTYCHNIWPRHHMFRSAENIMEEIKIFYDMGVRRFAFLDDIFNLNRENSARFFKLLVKSGMRVQLIFQNGVRGDILDTEYIDLLVEAGTICLPMALETSSARLQKMIRKNLNIDKLHQNMTYLCQKHPQVISSLYFMVGFPSETPEEARGTIDFVKSIKWIHLPEYFNLVIYPGTEMEQTALDHGVSREAIQRSMESSLIGLEPETFPFEDKHFVRRLRQRFFIDYWMNRERIKTVLPYQMQHMTERELLKMYDDFFQKRFQSVNDLLTFFNITDPQLQSKRCLDEELVKPENLKEQVDRYFSSYRVGFEKGMRLLLIDVNQAFADTDEDDNKFINQPLGIMVLATYVKAKLGRQIECTVLKYDVDYRDYEELGRLIDQVKPDVIGLSAVTMFKKNLYCTAKWIKDHHELPVLAGGAHSTVYDEILSESEVDLVVIGEGELTLLHILQEMIRHRNLLPPPDVLETIPGIAYRAKTALRTELC